MTWSHLLRYSKIEQSASDLIMIERLKCECRPPPWISLWVDFNHCAASAEPYSAPTQQISAKADYPRPSDLDPTTRRCFGCKCAELHTIWPGLLNTIGQCAVEVSTIKSISTAWFSVGTILDRLLLSVGRATCIKFEKEIEHSLALPTHLLDFRCYYMSKSEVLKLNVLGSKKRNQISHCGFKLILLRPNLCYRPTFGAGPLRELGNLTHFSGRNLRGRHSFQYFRDRGPNLYLIIPILSVWPAPEWSTPGCQSICIYVWEVGDWTATSDCDVSSRLFTLHYCTVATSDTAACVGRGAVLYQLTDGPSNDIPHKMWPRFSTPEAFQLSSFRNSAICNLQQNC